jgi:hypothetical protein
VGKNKKTEPQTTPEELAEACLHCAFFAMHGEKWPKWKPNSDHTPVNQEAFNDLVQSAVKIVAEIFTMLDPMGQMVFMHKVMELYTENRDRDHDSVNETMTLSEVLRLLRSAASNTKH